MNINRWLGATALVLGSFAAAAGTPARLAEGQIDVNELAAVITREEDHVGAVDLAVWIRERKPGLRVVDVRPATEFEEYHVPSAINVELDSLSRAGFTTSDTVVLYSQGGAHAAQAWILLRALGVRNVFFLSGGLDEWATDVMSPLLPDDATADERQQFERVADVSRYFGGTPRMGPRESVNAATTSAALTRLKRRGC